MNSHFSCRRVVLSCTLLFLAFLITCARTEWTDYKSEPAGFVASFPGKPTETSKTVNAAIGSIEMKPYGVSEQQTSFSVVVADYPAEHVKQIGSTALLDMAREGAVSNTQGTLLSEQIIQVEGNPGRELKISAAGGERDHPCQGIPGRESSLPGCGRNSGGGVLRATGAALPRIVQVAMRKSAACHYRCG